MNDKLLLILTGIFSAAVAWAFFYFSGQNAFSIMNIVLIICLVSDNYRLRKKLKSFSQSD